MRTAPAPSSFRPPPDPPPCGHFHGSLQLQPSSSVSNPIKQLSSPMAPVVTASPPSPLHLPPPPLRLRLPPDPPPWSSHRAFILVCLLSSIPVCSLVEWSKRFVVYVAPNLSVMDLDYNVPMNFVSFGSTSMPVDGSQVALVRSSTAQIEGKLVDTLISVNRVMEEFHYPMDSFVEQFIFPIFPSMWSELDGQASLVLQGSSFWLMLFSAFVAVFVTFEVTSP
ncbi:hypothetical protein Bca4012_086430 [Brassica carinata]